jgi:hypothetical protein
MDIMTLILRFIVGAIVGAIFVFVLWGVFLFSIPMPIYVVITTILVIGMFAAIWGDKFILWFSKFFKYL